MVVPRLPVKLRGGNQRRVRYVAMAGALLIVIIVSAFWWVSSRAGATTPHASHVTGADSLAGSLPGAEIWPGNVSSLDFGTNDSYEWSQSNLQTQPALQKALRTAGFTLIRSFFPDKSSDAVIEQRIKTIENSGAHCLGVITNIDDMSFNEHLVTYLGKRCLLYEFGNEPDYNGVAVNHYVQVWNTAIPMLRKINPQAKFIGPVTMSPSPYLQSYLDGVHTSGVLPDAVSFHWYPCWEEPQSSCMAKSTSIGKEIAQARQMITQTLGKQLPIGITEWNFNPSNPPPAYADDSAFMTQFSTQALQAMIQAGAAFACQFDAANYGGYGRLDMLDVSTLKPKPQYYAIAKLIAEYRPGGHAPAATAIPATPRQSASTSSALLSVGKQAFCSANNGGPGGPDALVDGKHGNWAYWDARLSDLPSWCAIKVPQGPSRLLLVWEMDFTSDYITPQAATPRDYTISVSSNSSNGSDGTWRTVATVSGNETRVREHLIPFSGQSWVKMTVTKGQPGQSDINVSKINLFDVSSSVNDSYIFSGDSITLFSYNQFDAHQPSFAADVHSASPSQYPATLDAGLGGWNSGGAVQDIDSWLALNPDVHYWLLGWGSNDALDEMSPDTFKTNMQTMVTKIKQAGHVPVLAHIPFSTYHNLPWLDGEIKSLNAAIDQVAQQNGLTPGPDFYTLFKQNPSYLSTDGLHPNDQGAVAMNEAWFKALQSTVVVAKK